MEDPLLSSKSSKQGTLNPNKYALGCGALASMISILMGYRKYSNMYANSGTYCLIWYACQLQYQTSTGYFSGITLDWFSNKNQIRLHFDEIRILSLLFTKTVKAPK